MAFSDQEVNRQIQHMVSFIEQEAAEKANEILVKAEEEFNIEKGRLVQDEKIKIMGQYEKKEKQVDVQRRIAFSNQVNKSRLRILDYKHSQVMSLLEAAKAQLSEITADADRYQTLMSELILEGCFRIMDSHVQLVVRAKDRQMAEGLVDQVVEQYKHATKLSVSIALSADSLPESCCGGVVVTSIDGRIKSGQHLDLRLERIYETLIPQIRVMLFGVNKARKHME